MALLPGQYDVRGALMNLLNMEPAQGGFYGDDTKDTAVEAFISRYGDLRQMPDFEALLKDSIQALLKGHVPPVSPVRVAAQLLRIMMENIDKGTEGPLSWVNVGLAEIFRPMPGAEGENTRPALLPNILTQKLEIAPRDFLDAIAVAFIHSYREIGRCNRCRRFYFIIQNGKYCSIRCGDLTKRERSRDSMKRLRAKQKQKKELRQKKTRRSS